MQVRNSKDRGEITVQNVSWMVLRVFLDEQRSVRKAADEPPFTQRSRQGHECLLRLRKKAGILREKIGARKQRDALALSNSSEPRPLHVEQVVSIDEPALLELHEPLGAFYESGAATLIAVLSISVPIGKPKGRHPRRAIERSLSRTTHHNGNSMLVAWREVQGFAVEIVIPTDRVQPRIFVDVCVSKLGSAKHVSAKIAAYFSN